MLRVLTDEEIKQLEREAKAVECNRCGLCCILPSGRDCRNLRRKSNGETYCAIWTRAGRLGSPIGEGQFCNRIIDVPLLFKGCTYNDIKVKYGIAENI